METEGNERIQVDGKKINKSKLQLKQGCRNFTMAFTNLSSVRNRSQFLIYIFFSIRKHYITI